VEPKGVKSNYFGEDLDGNWTAHTITTSQNYGDQVWTVENAREW